MTQKLRPIEDVPLEAAPQPQGSVEKIDASEVMDKITTLTEKKTYYTCSNRFKHAGSERYPKGTCNCTESSIPGVHTRFVTESIAGWVAPVKCDEKGNPLA
jgi:hypothetical protein